MTVRRRSPGKRHGEFLHNWSVPRQLAGAGHKRAAGEIGSRTAWRELPPQELKDHRHLVEAACLA